MSLKLVIQDAAEHVFAAHGFEGTSMRLIAERAGVAQALLHYHFKNKATLYASLFERRSSPANTGRLRHLDALLRRKKNPTLEDILESLLLPPAAIGQDHGGDYEMYQQLVTALSFSTDQRSKALMVRYYDPIARRFTVEFQKAVPGLSEVASVWSYLFALGARHQAQSKTGRSERLLKKKSAKGGPSAAALLLPFIAAGIRALARAPQTSRRNKRSARNSK
jgi:AcrR family transcriptional regulator